MYEDTISRVDGEIEDEVSSDLPEEPRVLVAVLNRVRDLDLAREQGWYRIPFKRAPAQIGADYIAFYHTAAFAQDRWSIRYYAPVCGYRLATRLELLPDESAHPRAAEKYYRLDPGPLQELPHPIPSKRLRRITFISTTLARLLAAREINDLWEGSPSAERLWAAFRDAAIEAERSYQVRERRQTYTADFVIACRAGPIAVLLGSGCEFLVPGWLALHFTPQQVLDDLPCCLELVQQAIRRQGGLMPVRAASASLIAPSTHRPLGGRPRAAGQAGGPSPCADT